MADYGADGGSGTSPGEIGNPRHHESPTHSANSSDNFNTAPHSRTQKPLKTVGGRSQEDDPEVADHDKVLGARKNDCRAEFAEIPTNTNTRRLLGRSSCPSQKRYEIHSELLSEIPEGSFIP